VRQNRKHAVDLLLRGGRKPKAPGTSWFVYILRCADGSLYTGITTDLARRYKQHNAGTASRYTRSRLPVDMVYLETRECRSSALKREAAIKALTRREKLAMIQLRAYTG
jgi:predicted GIY-YIG superfamily endonuclease